MFSLRNSLCVAPTVMRDTKEALENVSVTLEALQEGTGKLQFNLSVVRAGLSNALSNDPACADGLSPAAEICLSIRSSLSQLQISANYSGVQFTFSLDHRKTISHLYLKCHVLFAHS